jgi:hypothetical protein
MRTASVPVTGDCSAGITTTVRGDNPAGSVAGPAAKEIYQEA